MRCPTGRTGAPRRGCPWGASASTRTCSSRRRPSVSAGTAVTLVTLVSFDVDGTLEIGEPPGGVPIALVRTAKRLGYLIGSCSDRPIRYQQDMWQRLGIAPDFTVLKHRLEELKARFAAAAYYHIG